MGTLGVYLILKKGSIYQECNLLCLRALWDTPLVTNLFWVNILTLYQIKYIHDDLCGFLLLYSLHLKLRVLFPFWT